MSQGPEREAFKQLKPICVAILGLVPTADSPKLPSLLEDLHLKLVFLSGPSASGEQTVFPPSLVHYVFFPLSQLLRESAGGVIRLRDLVQERIFLCLSVLTEHWWAAWSKDEPTAATTAPTAASKFQVFDQLLILGAVTLNGSAKGLDLGKATRPNDSTRLAVVAFLDGLLRVRWTSPPALIQPQSTSDGEWEWDGESELPSLDDYDTPSSAPPKLSPFEPSRLYPTKEHVMHTQTDSSPRGAVSLAISSLLEIAASAEATTALRVRALTVLDSLLHTWISGAESDQETAQGASKVEAAKRAAVFLPGIVSTLQRTLLGKQKGGRISGQPHADVCAAALRSLRALLLLCLSDEATGDLRQDASGTTSKAKSSSQQTNGYAKSLENLVQQISLESSSDKRLESSAEMDEDLEVIGDEATAPKIWTSAWLRSTMQHVQAVLESLTPLSKHSSPSVQNAVVKLATALLMSAGTTLTRAVSSISNGKNERSDRSATSLLVSWLLDLAGEGVSNSVVTSARAALRDSLQEGSPDLLLIRRHGLEDETVATLRELSSSITSCREEAVLLSSQRVSTIVGICTGNLEHPAPSGALEALITLLGPSGSVDRWSSTLLAGLELQPGAGQSTDSELRFSHLEPRAASTVREMVRSIGRALAKHALQFHNSRAEATMPLDSFHLVRHFMQLAVRERSLRNFKGNVEMSARCAAALLVVDDLMKGIESVLNAATTEVMSGKEGKRARKVARHLCTEIVSTVSRIWDADEEEASGRDRAEDASASPEALVVGHTPDEVEHLRGMNALPVSFPDAAERMRVGPALNIDFVGSALLSGQDSAVKTANPMTHLTVQTYTRWQVQVSDSLMFSLLASSASMLGTSFRPAMLQNLYTLMCGLASPSPVLQQGAQDALARIADACGYATVQACVMDHADYVLGAASQRLLFGLSAELERTHAQSSSRQRVELPISSAQLSPLVMVQIITMLGPEAIPLVEDAIDEVLQALDRFHGYDELASGLIAVLDGLVEVMMQVRDEGEATLGRTESSCQPDGRADEHAFIDWFQDRRSDRCLPEEGPNGSSAEQYPSDTPDNRPSPSDPDLNPAPTRSQEVLAQILTKCVPFLSHAAPTLRARILAVLRRGVSILAPMHRDADIMTVINRAWSLILARLGTPATVKMGSLPGRVAGTGELSEQVPFVWVEAVALVEALAKYLPDLLGKRIIEEAWPRLGRLLNLQLHALQRPQAHGRIAPPTVSTDGKTSTPGPTRLRGHTFCRFPEESVPYRLLHGVLNTLSTTVRHLGATLTDDDAWAMTTHQVLSNALDDRQPVLLRSAALALFSALGNRDPNALWLVLHYSDPTTEGVPFLHQPYLTLETARSTLLQSFQ